MNTVGREKVWQQIPGLFRWCEVAEFAETCEGDREIRASKAHTDAAGQGLYRVYVLMENKREGAGRPRDAPASSHVERNTAL
jgi:hypothetical protein